MVSPDALRRAHRRRRPAGGYVRPDRTPLHHAPEHRSAGASAALPSSERQPGYAGGPLPGPVQAFGFSMKRILVVSGSRADYGLLEWPRKALCEDGAFSVEFLRIWHYTFPEAFSLVDQALANKDMLLILGDRFEILAAATAAHLKRVPIAHIGGGDVTLGSYDDAMRDCISRMASVHLVTIDLSDQRLWARNYINIHMIGNLAADEILRGDWKRERPIAEPYVVVSYQAETIDDTVDLKAVNAA